MTNRKQIDPIAALDAALKVVREEAVANPMFARRMLEALGYEVVFRGDEAVAAIDPIAVAMKGKEEFLRTFLSMPDADIEKIGMASNLLLKGAFKAPKGSKVKPTRDQVIETFWQRASDRLDDLLPRRRQAAE